TQKQMEEIGQLVQTLDKATLSASRELRLIPVDRSRADAALMAQALQRLLEQRGGMKVEIISADELLKQTEEKKDKRGSSATPLHPGWLEPVQLAQAAAAFGVPTEDSPDDQPEGPKPPPPPGGGDGGD